MSGTVPGPTWEPIHGGTLRLSRGRRHHHIPGKHLITHLDSAVLCLQRSCGKPGGHHALISDGVTAAPQQAEQEQGQRTGSGLVSFPGGVAWSAPLFSVCQMRGRRRVAPEVPSVISVFWARNDLMFAFRVSANR